MIVRAAGWQVVHMDGLVVGAIHYSTFPDIDALFSAHLSTC